MVVYSKDNEFDYFYGNHFYVYTTVSYNTCTDNNCWNCYRPCTNTIITIAYGNTELCKAYVVTIYFRTIINILIPADNNSNDF